MVGYAEVKDSHNSRLEPRVKLAVPFNLRFERSEPFTFEEVVSENISRKGLCIKTNYRIPLKTRVYLETPNHRCKALAVVVHSSRRLAGLQLLTSNGNWLIN